MAKNSSQTHLTPETKGWDTTYHLVLSYNYQKNLTATSQVKIFTNEFFDLDLEIPGKSPLSFATAGRVTVRKLNQKFKRSYQKNIAKVVLMFS